MRQLPSTSDAQYPQLNQCPADNFCVGGLTLVSEFSLSFLFIHGVSLVIEIRDGHYRPTRWKTCSLLTSCNLAFKSLTLPTMFSILSLSSLSMALDAPIARSKYNLTPPMTPCPGLLNHPPTLMAAGPEGVKQIRCKPLSAAVNMNLLYVDEDVVVCFTTR